MFRKISGANSGNLLKGIVGYYFPKEDRLIYTRRYKRNLESNLDNYYMTSYFLKVSYRLELYFKRKNICLD